jgi:putative endonuclease
MWFVYILECADGTFYTGITTDLKRRVQEHNSGMLGARYTRGRRLVKLCYSSSFPDKQLASKEEWRIKRMSKKEKLELVQTVQDQV